MKKILTCILVYISASVIFSQHVYAAEGDVLQSFSSRASEAKVYFRPSSDLLWVDSETNPIAETAATVDGADAGSVTIVALETPVSVLFYL